MNRDPVFPARRKRICVLHVRLYQRHIMTQQTSRKADPEEPGRFSLGCG